MLEMAPPLDRMALDRPTILKNQSYETYMQARETYPHLRVEYIQRDIVMTPSPTTKHQRIVRNLIVQLDALGKTYLPGEVFSAPLDVALEAGVTIVQPDVMFIHQTHIEAIVQESRIAGAPDLLIEILSPSTARLDRAVKLELYAHYRVPEYWIVNPIDQTIEIYTLQAEGYLVAGIYEPGETIAAGQFAQAQLAVNAILGSAEQSTEPSQEQPATQTPETSPKPSPEQSTSQADNPQTSGE